jgi:hypothetical protein
MEIVQEKIVINDIVEYQCSLDKKIQQRWECSNSEECVRTIANGFYFFTSLKKYFKDEKAREWMQSVRIGLLRMIFALRKCEFYCFSRGIWIIDLHGYSRVELKIFLSSFESQIMTQFKKDKLPIVHFVTGKGIHSKSPVGIAFELLAWLEEFHWVTEAVKLQKTVADGVKVVFSIHPTTPSSNQSHELEFVVENESHLSCHQASRSLWHGKQTFVIIP